MNLARESLRKSLHFTLILLPILYCYFGKWPFLMVLSPIAAIVIGLDYLRRDRPKLNQFFIAILRPVLRDFELGGKKLCGASFVVLSACFVFLIFSKEIAVTAFTILVISDGLAALVGKAVVSQPFYEKSLAGAAAFAISGFAILVTCGIIFDSRAWFYLFGLFALFCVTMLESRPSLLGIDDNFTIPAGFAAIMGFFDILWNYNY
jgi:dolichol kinase